MNTALIIVIEIIFLIVMAVEIIFAFLGKYSAAISAITAIITTLFQPIAVIIALFNNSYMSSLSENVYIQTGKSITGLIIFCFFMEIISSHLYGATKYIAKKFKKKESWRL